MVWCYFLKVSHSLKHNAGIDIGIIQAFGFVELPFRVRASHISSSFEKLVSLFSYFAFSQEVSPANIIQRRGGYL